MVPTDPPGLEGRNVRWCHCACREPHLSPAPCCSAWGSCSRGRTRWPEWKWQERLSERGDKYLWQLLLNKYPPYLGSDGSHFNAFKLTSFHARVSTSPCPLARRQEHNPRREENTICSGAQKPFSQAEPFLSCSVCLQGLQIWWNRETLSCTAVRLHCSGTMCSHSPMFALLHLQTLCFVTGGDVRPSPKALSLQNSFQSIIGIILWQESTFHTHPLPLAGLIFTMILLYMSTGRLLAFIRKVLECISWIGQTNEANFYCGDPQWCSFNQFTRGRKQMARKKTLSTIQ